MPTPRVLVPIAAGFEEIEAVAIIDTLRRAGITVVVAGLEPGPVTGSHDITLQTDTHLDELQDMDFDMIVLPGGMPGAEHLHDDSRIQAMLRNQKNRGGAVAAICAAPWALVPSGWITGHSVTSYPSFEDRVTGGVYLQDRVVIDDNIITSRGPGTALEFALAVTRELMGQEKADEIRTSMLVHGVEDPRDTRAT